MAAFYERWIGGGREGWLVNDGSGWRECATPAWAAGLERATPAEIEAERANEPDDRERQERERYEAL